MISADRISRRFGDCLAVEDVSFDVRPGEVFGLLGPNGAGKTTTLRMLGGLILPTSGSVRIRGQPFTRATGGALRAHRIPDNLHVYARLFAVAVPRLAVERVLRMLELWDRRRDAVALLSKGMKQKLALGRALVHDPKVILLDEPTANLDPQTSRTVALTDFVGIAVMPLMVMFVGQIAGAFVATTGMLAMVTAGIAVAWCCSSC
ncbi:MAG TPA: ABC transporter ATP-binding protein [Vicinamibacterales bacterium]|nr:ABC transporter ATP-binding protein [Vicinamibacterales bacterium]